MNRLRRLRNRVLRGITAVSLLMALGTAAMWVRSYWDCDWVYYTVHHQREYGCPDIVTLCGVVPNNGRAQFEWFVSDYDGDVESSNRLGRWSWGHLTQGAQSLQWGWRAPAVRVPAGQWLGFGYGSSRPWDFVIDNRAYTDEDGARFVIIPYWFLAGTFSILPILALLKARRGPRYAAGHCQVCGYDLRATPERCPECGTVPL